MRWYTGWSNAGKYCALICLAVAALRADICSDQSGLVSVVQQKKGDPRVAFCVQVV